MSTCEQKNERKRQGERKQKDRQGDKEMWYWMCLSEILAQWMPTAECVAAKDKILSICRLITDCQFHRTSLCKTAGCSVIQCVWVFKILDPILQSRSKQ